MAAGTFHAQLKGGPVVSEQITTLFTRKSTWVTRELPFVSAVRLTLDLRVTELPLVGAVSVTESGKNMVTLMDAEFELPALSIAVAFNVWDEPGTRPLVSQFTVYDGPV